MTIEGDQKVFGEREPVPGKIAYKFPGQGSQHPGMAEGLIESPVARSVFEEASEILNFDLLKVCVNGSEDDLRSTEIAQVAILATSIALLEVTRELNPNLPEPSFYLGHSLGEYTAYVASGALDFGEAVPLVWERGKIMKQGYLRNPGGMRVISGARIDIEQINDICARVWEKDRTKLVQVANINTPDQIVLSGTDTGLDEACSAIKDLNGFKIIPLKQVAGPYHSLLIDPENKFAGHVSTANFKDTRIPVIPNTTGRPTNSGREMQEAVKNQHIGVVRWSDSMGYALNKGVKIFAQFGPGGTLVNLLTRIDGSAKGIKVNDLSSAYNFAFQEIYYA